LLIFFIIVMKFKQIERRQASRLPDNEGPNPVPAEEVLGLTIRMKWDKTSKTMAYSVDVGKENTLGQPTNIAAGSLADLMNDRVAAGNPHYNRVYSQLLDRLKDAYRRAGKVEKVEIAMASDTKASSLLQVEDTAPWGFVTMAVDACTGLNMELKSANEKMLGVTFKDTQAGTPIRLGG
jgi:hypothetical protein